MVRVLCLLWKNVIMICDALDCQSEWLTVSHIQEILHLTNVVKP